MNVKRKAELQRKLALAPVPKPPAGLAERIKNDIPEYLRPDADRRRHSRTVAFNMRIAASVLIVISAVIGAIYLLTPEEQLIQMASKAQPPIAGKMEDKVAAATDQVEVEITQSMPVEQPAVQVAEAADTETFGYSTAVRRDQAPDVGLGRSVDEVQIAAAEPAPAPVPPPAPAPVAPPPSTTTMAADAAVAQSVVATEAAPQRAETRPAARITAAPSLIPEAYAAERKKEQRDDVFGISVDPDVFLRLKETLERSQRPQANAVNIEALINYFAGAPAKAPRRGIRLEAEGSPSPVGGGRQHGFLRFTIDTPETGSALPLGANATLTIEMNGKVVERADAVGDSPTLSPEAALLPKVSVTGLYELTLKPNLRASDRVATVRLTYNRPTDGKKQTIEKAVYARDFARTWTRASRRHRLASLGAVWGQSLKVAAPAPPEVARRAEELATQEPGDERAQELATAATASSKLTNGF